MKYDKILIVIGCSLILSNVVSAQWRHAEGNMPNWGTGWAIDAVDSMTAAISVGPGIGSSTNSIAITTDGGVTWNVKSLPSNRCGIDLSMTDAAHLWTVTAEGLIYASTDGGNTWTLQFFYTAKTNFINYIEMFNATEGIAMGDGNSAQNIPPWFLHTSNGGATWTVTQPSSLPGEVSGDTWRRLDFVDRNTGFFYGSKTGTMMKTTDGGATWTPIPFPIKTGPMNVKFYNASIGLATVHLESGSSVPYVYRTTDGGASWQSFKVSSSSAGWGMDLEFVPGDPSKVWLCMSSKIFFSSDTGRTWTEQSLDKVVFSRDIQLVPGGCAWLLADVRTLYRAPKATAVLSIQTGIEHSITVPPTAFELSQNYPNPFNPSTTITFSLHSRSQVKLSVFDLMGREVAGIVSDELSAGVHTRVWDASGMPSGVYFYRLQAGSFSETRRLAILK